MLIEKKARYGLEQRRALYSECEQFRYLLEIKFGTDLFVDAQPAMLAYIGLNPSTATEEEDDPTVVRCKRRARELGFVGMTMLNLYAYRATDPQDMKKAGYLKGEANDRVIRSVCAEAGMVILCFGNHGQAERVDELRGVLHGIPVHALNVAKNGRPMHPLYLSMDLKPKPYEWVTRERLKDVGGGDRSGAAEEGSKRDGGGVQLGLPGCEVVGISGGGEGSDGG